MPVERFVRDNLDVIVACALALLVCVLAITATPLPSVISDSYAYTMTAQRLVRDGFFAYSIEPPGADIAPNAVVTPGHVLTLGAAYGIFGRSGSPLQAVLRVQPIVVVLQVGLVLVTVGALALAGRELGGRKLGTLAGVLGALYVPFAWSASVAMPECLGVTLLSVQLAWGIRLARPTASRSVWSALGFGALAAAIVLVRPAMALMAVAMPLYVLVRRLESPRRLALLLAAGIAGVLLVMAPWWVRNAVVIGKFVPLRTNLVKTTDGYEVIGEDQSASVATPAETGFWRTLEAEVAMPWSAPYDVLWQKHYYPDSPRIDLGAFDDPLQAGMLARMRVVRVYHIALLVAALAGFAFVRRSPRLLLALALPVVTLAAHWGTQVNNRYMFLGMPGVVIAAAAAIFALGQLARRRFA